MGDICFVYKYTSPSNKSYVGMTNDLERREKEHSIADMSCPKFHAAIVKYDGIKSFDKTILEYNLSREDAKELEKYYIKFFDSFENGYNCTTGGDGLGYGSSHPTSVAVRSLNLRTGDEQTFGTIREAGVALGISEQTISHIINEYEAIMPSGNVSVRRWARGNDGGMYMFQKYDFENPHIPFVMDGILTTEERVKKAAAVSAVVRSKPVIGTHMLGYTIEFESAMIAGQVLNIDNKLISANATGKGGPVDDYTWTFACEEERIKHPVWKSKSKIVPIYRTRVDGKHDKYECFPDAVKNTGITRKIIENRIRSGCVDSEGSLWYS